MREIFLPTLKKIKIQNFTLYPNGLDFEYDFVNGVNVIMGGNGMGKTTFVNLIKYSIIGHYKKEFDFTQTYMGRKIEKRKLYHSDFYKNRQDNSISTDTKPTVTINFEINNNVFSVERCIERITLNSYSFNGNNIDGEIITQYKYENLNRDEKGDYLQKKYEDHIEETSGLSFDDLIFFINEILFFGEDHKTILWNDGKKGYDVQEELFNKYCNPKEIDYSRKEADRLARYFDSQAKARSEERKAIKDVLDKIAGDVKNNIKPKSLNSQIFELTNKIQKLDEKIEKKQTERKTIESKNLIINNQINEISLQDG